MQSYSYQNQWTIDSVFTWLKNMEMTMGEDFIRKCFTNIDEVRNIVEGGDTGFLLRLLPPLEILCRVEDNSIRQKAVEALTKVGFQMKETEMMEHFIPFVKPSSHFSPFPPNHFAACLPRNG